ncbi:beta-galactosidase [Streptacidiphilus sp. PB12-B1b]|uniref:beta-galactosidase n=1 Tax=Streptacidiphilus sp. PB12-B1b TaxID=2705012 RepID=UPI0015FB737B|nr:beta-galactosidase [Streptacidiphilus sp. PB12-B1b]QMU76438.1 beta-galactosidase [Streptacidiphilus sp. PB12-B1b]
MSGQPRSDRPRFDLGSIAYGGDYNPEQWPEEVWPQDVALMREAGVNLVSLGIFSWARLEPQPGVFDFGWLDRIIALLHEGGISIDLATPTAAPPAWFQKAHPQVRPVAVDGTVLGYGARQTYCPSSPEYAEAAARITAELARRYAGHPAVVLWHIHNEYGCHISRCYCEQSVAAFRVWLEERYKTVEGLNAAWGTAFWGQLYGSFDEVDAPRTAPAACNPAQQVDFRRFSSDALLECYRRERDIVRAADPVVPITTNFMAGLTDNLDLWRWAEEVDVVATDHYLTAERSDNHIGLSLAADLTRSLAGGGPWLLMEHSTSAVNWQGRNIAKRPGEMARNSMAHLARGADGIMFFQWRQSRSGTEKFHSAMVPHAGTDTRHWRDVVALGTRLGKLDEVCGSRVQAPQVALVWDWESRWGLDCGNKPSTDLGFRERIDAYYERLWHLGVTVDFVHPGADLSGYRLVLAPSLYHTRAAWAENLRAWVRGGGTLVSSYFTGVVDENEAVHLGGYPGALRDILGVRAEEFLPLRSGQKTRLASESAAVPGGSASRWAEDLHLDGAAAVLRHADGPAAGCPAVTRHGFGEGTAWYVATAPEAGTLTAILRAACADAGVALPVGRPEGLEAVRRVAEGGAEFDFLINHNDRDVTVPLAGSDLVVPAGRVRVVVRTS